MIKKLLVTLHKLKSCAGLCFGIHDLAELFFKLWSLKEWLLIGTVILWVPLLKIASLLYSHFGIRVTLAISSRYSKVVLWAAYWFTVFAVVINLMIKYHDGCDTFKLLSLIACYVFVLVMDFIETEEAIQKIKKMKGS